MAPSLVDAITGFDYEPDGSWSFQDYTGDGIPDLIYIKTQNTASGKVEVHVATSESNYKTFVLRIATVFPIDPPFSGTWLTGYYTGGPKPDLIYIKTVGTSANFVEVYIANASSDYQTITLRATTIYPENNSGYGTWTLADFNGDGLLDLIYIKSRSTSSGKVAVSVASGASNFRDIIFNFATGIPNTYTGLWGITKNPTSNKLDLIWLNNEFTASGKVEVFVLSGAGDYLRWDRAVPSIFGTNYYNAPTSSYLIAQYKAGLPFCLVQVNWKDTASKKTELHVVNMTPFRFGGATKLLPGVLEGVKESQSDL
ncbi:hypothetical protein TWF281_007098 [Arthrobotrys megalospora]